MDKEFDVLEHISNDKNITQRKIAEKTGLSLGTANILVKRLIKKGLIKVEQINSRTLRYILTPAGIVEKTKRTYEFITYSISYITGLNKRIKEYLSTECADKTVYLYGEKDEVYSIVANAVKELSKSVYSLDLEDIGKVDFDESSVILVWNVECEGELRQRGIRYKNILAG